MPLNRRHLLVGGIALATGPAFAQGNTHPHHAGQFERLGQPGRMDLPDLHHAHAAFDSPAPRAARQGAWRALVPLPIPRTEMAWAAEFRGRVHLVGGYAEQRVDRPYHHAYDPGVDRWEELPPLPRGANHVGVAALDGRLYAFGGFLEQNRTPHDGAYAFDGERWHTLRRRHRQVVGAGPGELTGRGRYWSRAQAAAATPLMSAHTPNARALAARYSLAETWSRRRWKRLLIWSWAERKRCAWPVDLKRFICRSRRRVGWCEFSARLLRPLCRRCSTPGISSFFAAP
jgi:Kelch motif